ncbi:HAD family hydrolase [Pararcticibacter amylolyticus]|uniref:phosphoglycolate phosphatase n=1 Tax=Pararcticibacter amylolyticus TaxID=2173175 RepID=A0A2U2PIG8_9SPHI|nr:HAD family hydrolase [Pararcticibacter amylolyticus]PWG81062.1 haloacid dehalogenase [Pararcticibacter amylolyticus]
MSIKNILFDFDGVILDSNGVRERGFEMLFAGYSAGQLDTILRYHRNNGGLSRYHKIRYFYEEVLQKEISEEEVNQLAEKFSVLMKKELVNRALIIEDAVAFIRDNYRNYEMHIVSGSDGNELRYLCAELGLAGYFKTIQGSPVPKITLVGEILDQYHYQKEETVLIGDSINDYDAAKANGIGFLAYRFVSEKEIQDIRRIKSINEIQDHA